MFLTVILSIYDYVSRKKDLIAQTAYMNTLPRWIVYDMMTVLIFFIYTLFAVTNASFVYFQF